MLLQVHAVDEVYYFFVFSATICSYNFHWYLTPADYSMSDRIQWGVRHKTLQLVLTIAGGAGATTGFWILREHWLPLSGAALLTFLYSAPKIPQRAFIWLRKIAIGKTLFLTFVWTYVTTLLPLFIEKEPITWQVIWFTIHRFSLVYAICILFDYRDLESDKQEGIRSLITWLSGPGLKKLYIISLLLSAVSGFILYLADRNPFTLLLPVPVAVTALLTRYALRNRSDHFYYFVLDGMVMLSALLHIIIAAGTGLL